MASDYHDQDHNSVSVEAESGRKRQKLNTMYEYSRSYILDKNKTQ